MPTWPATIARHRSPGGRRSTRARCAGCSTPPSRSCGSAARPSRPRVADIVAAAGLSNDAFYRHFASKEALVAAILEDGTARLTSYLDHQMAKAPTPADKVRRFVEGVMSQAADDDIAATTLRGAVERRQPSANGWASSRSSPARARWRRCCASRSRSSAAPTRTPTPCSPRTPRSATLSDFLWQRTPTDPGGDRPHRRRSASRPSRPRRSAPSPKRRAR